MEGESQKNQENPTLFKLSIRNLSNVTLILPLTGLFVCFVSGYIFQNDEIHETHCRVYNVIPSISSITGISPQRYLWRVVIALHISPRLVISFVHKNHLKICVLSKLTNRNQLLNATRLAKIVHYLSLIEISALAGVTYVSNKENYPIHEKIFITFMIISISYQAISLRLFKVIHPTGTPLDEKNQRSIFYKYLFFGISIASTIGLIVFFLKHRLLCHDLAFSWFAFCEYLIAFSNMGFHYTTVVDFSPELDLLVKNADGHVTISRNNELEDVKQKINKKSNSSTLKED